MRKRYCSGALAIVVGVGCGLPYWEGTVPPFVPREDPCGSGALTPQGRRELHRLPYLQSARPDGVVVAWAGWPRSGTEVVVARAADDERTPVARATGFYIGPDPDGGAMESYEPYDDSDEGGEVGDGDDADARAVAPEDFRVLAASVDQLPVEEGGYCYRLVRGEAPLTDWATLALAPPADPDRVDRFVILGDTGNGQPAQHAIARRFANAPTDAVIFLGDIAYTSGSDEELQERFFDVYANLFQRVPVYAAIGNHDNRTEHGRPFEEAFLLPGNERWYSFDLGDVHFVALDTTRIGREQAEWLEADLAQNQRKFIVVLGHHPPYTAARRGPNMGFRRWFVPVLKRHPVELVLTGHEHHYERTKPLSGIVYIVSGGGGAHLTRTGWNKNTVAAFPRHHYLMLEARRDDLVVRAIDIDGNLMDEVVIPDRRDDEFAAGEDRRVVEVSAISAAPSRSSTPP